jgi:hypothetical protein
MIRELFNEFKQNKIVKVYRPASQSEIDTVADELGVPFPQTYVDFLRTCGLADIYDRTIFGLGPDTHPRKNGATRDGRSVQFHTLRARALPDVGLPRGLVAIWHDRHRDYQCLDTNRIKDGDCPVVYFDTQIAGSRNPNPKEIARGFHDWLHMKVDEQTKRKADHDGDEWLQSFFRKKTKKKSKKKAKARVGRNSARKNVKKLRK